ncbi:MAG TPA: hypothetical protein VIJ92_04415 [Ginsengibacter sp.]
MKTVETKTNSKKDVQKIIKDGLTSILTDVNPHLDKKDLKKSIKKAGKVLYRGAKIKKSGKKVDEVAAVSTKS